MQFLACVLKAVIPGGIVPRAYLEREWDRINPFGFVALVIFLFLPVVSMPGASAIVAISVTAEVVRHGVCHVTTGATCEDINTSCSIA